MSICGFDDIFFGLKDVEFPFSWTCEISNLTNTSPVELMAVSDFILKTNDQQNDHIPGPVYV